ncbi:MAG: hypothetical protein R2845_13935 [Thermomicrobiales bacterium]
MSFAERTTRFITDPVVAGLLLTVGLLLIVFDFADGLGIAALAGLAMIGTFFWGHMVAGLAGWEDLVLGSDRPWADRDRTFVVPIRCARNIGIDRVGRRNVPRDARQ